MVKTEILETLLPSKNDAKVCGALLNFGEQNVGELGRATGIHRRNIHDSLNRLIERGFVSKITKNNVQFFRISDAENIIDRLEIKKAEIEEAIPEIMKTKDRSEEPEIQFWTGPNAFKYMLEDELKTKDKIYVISATHFEEKIWDYYEKNYYKVLRGENKLKILFVQKDKEIGKKAEKYRWVEARYLPDTYQSEVGFELYRDNVCLILPNIIIRIKSKEIKGRMKTFFDLLWKNADIR